MIVFNDPNDGDAIAAVSSGGCPYGYNSRSDIVIARRENGRLLGGAIFYGYSPGRSISVHVAALVPGALSKDLLWVCLHYPFKQLNCLKLLSFIPGCNLKSLELARRLGFTEEARIADAYDGDLVISSLRREDCLWLDRIRPSGIRSGREC